MKNKLKSIVLALFMASLAPLAAQRTYLPTPDDFSTFLASTTYVVLDGNPMSDYNFAIREAVEKEWNITAYEIIEQSELDEKLKDETASFLFLAAVNLEKDKSRARYNFLCLSLGGEGCSTANDLRDLANVPYSYYGIDDDYCQYHLSTLVRFLQKHVRTLADTPSLVSQNVYQFYNKDMGLMKDKVLYLVRDELASDISTDKQIAAIYPYPFKVVEREEVLELIEANDEKAVFMHKVGPQSKTVESRVYKMLISVADAHLYYYNYHKASTKNPDAILRNDLRRIGKASK